MIIYNESQDVRYKHGEMKQLSNVTVKNCCNIKKEAENTEQDMAGH